MSNDETKPGWASMQTVADMLVASSSIERIEFYVTKYDNKPAELNCRCFMLPGMNKQDIENLSGKLNEAIAPVLQGVSGGIKSKAANQLRRFL